jgi:hypothetical protein
MTEREKLIKLLGGDMCKGCCCYDCEYETDEKGCIEEIKRKMADHLLANGVTFQKWIPVSERLPEEHGTFIVALYMRSRKRKYSDSATFDPVVKRWRTHLFWGKGMKITHWMPLPEPPQEE